MANRFDKINRKYEFKKSSFPIVEKPFLFWTTRRITKDKNELIEATRNERIEITQNILNTLEKGLERKVEVAGIDKKDFLEILSFSDKDLIKEKYMDFKLIDNKDEDIGSLTYMFPHWVSGYYSGKYLDSGGVELALLGSAIKNNAQYNSIQIGLRKVQSD